MIFQVVRRMLSRDVPQRIDGFVADDRLFHRRQTLQRRQKTMHELVPANQLETGDEEEEEEERGEGGRGGSEEGGVRGRGRGGGDGGQ